jgi:hypothetical protein
MRDNADCWGIQHGAWASNDLCRDLKDGIPLFATILEAQAVPASSVGTVDRISHPEPQTTKPVHSEDFTFVSWYGAEYTFALGVQSSAVRALWQEWEKTGLGLHQETIRNAIDVERDSFRMDTAFCGHVAFGAMIQRCGDGKYRLNPDSSRRQPCKKAKNRRNRA